MSTLAGVAILVSGLALLRVFRPARGQAVVRHEWVEISVAITVTMAIGFGLMLAISEIGGLLLAQ